jgi:hypothetical protein
MLRRLLTISGLALVALLLAPSFTAGASGQVPLPLNHRLNGILVDLHRPKLFFGHERVSRGFVASRDGLVLASLDGLEDVGFGDEIKLEWMDNRTAEGWLVWKDEELGYVIVRIIDPMPLFPSMGWRGGIGPRPGEELFAPGLPRGGQPTLSRVVVTGIRDLSLPSGRQIWRSILLTPSLGSGPLSGPLLDGHGRLVGMVSSLAPPPGAGPNTFVAVPAEALQPDLRAARSMRSPQRFSRPPIAARPSYGIGIGIGSGGIRPRFGVGLGGFGSRGTYGMRRDRWNEQYDPRLRNEQEATDRAKTEALERALEQRVGTEPRGNAPLLTNSQPLSQGESESAAVGPWKAGASSVTTATGSGEVREVRPEAYRQEAPTMGSTWNPAGPPLATAPAPSKPQTWPVVVEPNVPPSVKAEQEETDRARTHGLEQELARRGVQGSPPGASGEITVLTTPPASQPLRHSCGENVSDLAVLRACNEALEKELELLKQGVSGRQ